MRTNGYGIEMDTPEYDECCQNMLNAFYGRLPLIEEEPECVDIVEQEKGDNKTMTREEIDIQNKQTKVQIYQNWNDGRKSALEYAHSALESYVRNHDTFWLSSFQKWNDIAASYTNLINRYSLQ